MNTHSIFHSFRSNDSIKIDPYQFLPKKKAEKKKVTTTMTTATTHQRHATIAHEWLLKSVEIILSSRRGGNSSATPSTVGKTDKKKKKIKKKKDTRSWWFNLEPTNFLLADKNEQVECNGMDEEEGEGDDEDGGDADAFAFDSIRKQLEPWRLNDNELGFNPTPLVVDIFHCHENDEKEQKQEKENEEAFLVERWVLSVDPLIASDGACASKPSHETSIMYKKAVIQTRVLISLLRSLPAHRLQRRARLQLRADAGKMFHKIYATTTSDCKPKNINGENFVWRTFMFSKIDTKVGSMHARCFFLDEYSLNESRKVPGMSCRNGSASSSSSLAAAAALAVTADVSVSPHKIEERKDVQQQKTKVKGLLTTELAKCEKNLSKGDGAIAVDTSQKSKPSKNFVPVNASSAPSNLFDAIRSRTETCAADVPGTSVALLPSMKASSFGRESPNFNFQQIISPYGSPAVHLEPPEQARTLVVSPRIATFSSNSGGKTSIAQENENEDDLFALDEDVSQAASFEKTKNTDMEIGALVRMLKDAPGLCPLDSSNTFEDAQERLEAFKVKMKNSSSSAEEDER